MSVATTGVVDSMKFRIRIYEREDPISNRTLDYTPHTDKVKHDPYNFVSSVGPQIKRMHKKTIDSYSTDDKQLVTFVRTQTITVNPNTPALIKFKVPRYIKKNAQKFHFSFGTYGIATHKTVMCL
jgi:hypothetical protein